MVELFAAAAIEPVEDAAIAIQAKAEPQAAEPDPTVTLEEATTAAALAVPDISPTVPFPISVTPEDGKETPEFGVPEEAFPTTPLNHPLIHRKEEEFKEIELSVPGERGVLIATLARLERARFAPLTPQFCPVPVKTPAAN